MMIGSTVTAYQAPGLERPGGSARDGQADLATLCMMTGR
jgi:hypothetical protein